MGYMLGCIKADYLKNGLRKVLRESLFRDSLASLFFLNVLPLRFFELGFETKFKEFRGFLLKILLFTICTKLVQFY